MEMHQIRYFLAVCDTGNFTRAAERCHVSQPSLSRAIRNLEWELRGALFQRNRRGVALTSFGRLIHRHVREIERHAQITRQAALCWQRNQLGHLRIGTAEGAGIPGLAALLAEYHARFPDIELELRAGSPADLCRDLLGGDLDIALTWTRLPDHRLIIHELNRERLALGLPAGHRLARRAAVRLADLAEAALVTRAACPLSRRLLDACREQGIEPRIVARCHDRDDALGLVAAGIGATVVPASLAPGAGLVCRPIAAPELHQPVLIASLPKHRLPVPAQALLELRTLPVERRQAA